MIPFVVSNKTNIQSYTYVNCIHIYKKPLQQPYNKTYCVDMPYCVGKHDFI